MDKRMLELVTSILEEAIVDTHANGLHATRFKLTVLLAFVLALNEIDDEQEASDKPSWERKTITYDW